MFSVFIVHVQLCDSILQKSLKDMRMLTLFNLFSVFSVHVHLCELLQKLLKDLIMLTLSNLLLLVMWFSSIVCFEDPIVKTTSGYVRGKTIEVLSKSMNQFFNIPYAEPPLRRLLALKKPKQLFEKNLNFC